MRLQLHSVGTVPHLHTSPPVQEELSTIPNCYLL